MNDLFESPRFTDLLNTLQQMTCEDSVTAWPADQLQAMAQAGVFDWDIPVEWQGIDLEAGDMLDGLRLLASSCLVSTFVLTQRSAAVRRIVTSANEAAKQNLLPRLQAGHIFATVGISHLTTSGQHLRAPLVQATVTETGFELNGVVPWVTGATMADYVITGGTLDDGRQILVALPTDREGVDVQPPVSLMALNSSQTGAMKLQQVSVSHAEVLHGPVEAVMSQGTGGGAGSLGTSALAVGTTSATLRQMEVEAVKRPDLREFIEPLQAEHDSLVDDIHRATAGLDSDAGTAMESIRQRANSLVLRSAQAWLAATKGAGFVAGHPAERAVRESMFFLVWSCPQPVLTANLQEFACAGSGRNT